MVGGLPTCTNATHAPYSWVISCILSHSLHKKTEWKTPMMHFPLKLEMWPWWQLKERYTQDLTIKVRGKLPGCLRKTKSLRLHNQVKSIKELCENKYHVQKDMIKDDLP